MATITKTFHDHIRLSNVDGHGIKQILYPETTSDDIIMSDGTKLSHYLTNISDNLEFVKPTSISNAKGVMFIDSNNETFPGLIQNSSSLWIGARNSTSYHHKGSVYISSGWTTSNNQFTPNATIKVSIPKDANSDGVPDGADNYDVLHSGNYSQYAIPMSGSLNVTGNLGISTAGAGLSISDTKGQFIAISERQIDYTTPETDISLPTSAGTNGNALVIGFNSTTNGPHHIGPTYISTGWYFDNNDGMAQGHETLYLSLPLDMNYDGIPDSSRIVKVLHSDNFSRYAIPLSGSIYLTGDLGMSYTSKGFWLHDGKEHYPGLYNNGDNLWIGASAKESYHHFGMSFISAGWHNYARKYINSKKTEQTAVMVLNRAYSPTSNSRTIRIYNSSTHRYENYVLPANRTGVNIDDVKVSLPGVSYGDWVKATSEMSGVEPNETVYISLPEFDVVEGYYYSGQFYTTSSHTTTITPDTTHIYLDLGSGKLYKWNGNSYVITTEIIPTTATNYPVLHSGNSGNYDINFDSFRGITFTNTYTTMGADTNEIKYFALRDSGTNLWIGAEKGDAFHHLGKTFISAGWNYDYLGSSTNRSIYVSVPRVVSGQYPYDQSGCDNYEVVHAGIINEYLENSVGYGLSSTDQMISTYKSINSTDHVDIGDDIDLKDVGLIKNSGSNFWIGCNKAESYHHYGQVMISSGWRYRDLKTDAEVSIADALQHPSGAGGYMLWSKKFDDSGIISTHQHAYLAPYESVKISVPKYRFDSSDARSYKDSSIHGTYNYDEVGDVFYGDDDNPMIPNDCDNYDILHKGNFQSWFYSQTWFFSFCSSHAAQIKSALGIS